MKQQPDSFTQYKSLTPSSSYHIETESKEANITVTEIQPTDKMEKPMMSLAPCASTASLFIFAQGSSIVCVKHDTLEIDKRFEAHTHEISLIAADTNNESGDGQVISLDVTKEAVVWDCSTGEEISRFTAYEEIRVATFLRNGTIALGDNMGNIILFDPVRSEAVSCRTFQIPICAIAPAADSNFFAIGYQNGATIIATLMPTFVIHHTLANGTDTGFPVTVLAWHGSSSRQKSDMLASQTNDGDLKVWSIAKPIDGGEAARVVRVLKKPDAYPSRRNWMSWSRNGRILQYSDYDTSIWDVRTKKVTWEAVMSKSTILAISVFGPKGFMFTIDRQHNVQQYNLYPPQMVANAQHAPAVAPPSPPVSVRDPDSQYLARKDTNAREQAPYDTSRPDSKRTNDMERSVSQRSTADRPDSKGSKISVESKPIASAIRREDTRTPLGQIAHELEMLEEMEKSHLKSHGMSRSDSMQSNGSGHMKTPSITSSIRSYNSIASASELSLNSATKERFDDLATPRRFHPLSQEIGMSPITPRAPVDALRPYSSTNGPLSPTINGDTESIYDEHLYFVPPIGQLELFPNLKDKISVVSYKTPLKTDRPKYDDERRKEMFATVFGFDGDAESLIREEISQHPARSLQSLMLRLWLKELDANSLAVLMGSETLVPSDWMFIALSAMGGAKAWQQTIRIFIMRLIQKNDIHNTVMCFLILGEREQAIDQYISNKKYMEAVLLTALLSKDWRRLSALVRKWGEHAAEHGEGSLAMRCFACTENTPEAVPVVPIAPPGGHSRKSSLSGSIKSPTSPPKTQGLKLKTSRPTSPPVGNIRNTAARFFGFGDKNRGDRSAEANIMEMPWNRPLDERLPPPPGKPGSSDAPRTPDEASEKKEMVISGPINTTPFDARIGTPALPRVTSPGFAAPGRIGSPALSMISHNLPNRTLSPGPPSVAPDRSISPRPPQSNMLPLRMASAGAPEGGIIPPQRTGSSLAQRKPPGLQLQHASFQDVLASEPSPELTRSHPKLGGHQLSRSVSKLQEVEVPSEDEPEQPVPTRSASHANKNSVPSHAVDDRHRYDDHGGYDARPQRSNQERQLNDSRYNKQSNGRYHDQSEQDSYAEDSYAEDSANEEAERNLAARRRSLERLEREMKNMRLEKTQSIHQQRSTNNQSRGTMRRVKSPNESQQNTARGKSKQMQQYDATTEEEYSEDDRRYARPKQSDYDTSEVSGMSEEESYYDASRRAPARAPSRNANKTPRVASRTGHRAPPARVPSRAATRTPMIREEEEFVPPKRVQSRTTNRTPKPRPYEAENQPLSPPRRVASRNVSRTPRPRYDDDVTEEEEYEDDLKPRRRAPPKPVDDFTESEADDYQPPARQPSRNQARNNSRHMTETESEYDEQPRQSNFQRSQSMAAVRAGLPSNPSRNGDRARSPIPPIPRSKTPSNANKAPSRSTTPAMEAHRRKPSVGNSTMSPPPLPTLNNGNHLTSNKEAAHMPEYDRHDYDLPALAAAAAAAKVGSPPPQERGKPVNTLLDSDRMPSHPQALRAKLNNLESVPQSPKGLPSGLPTHPAFAGNLRATTGLQRKPTTAKPSVDDASSIKTQTVSTAGFGNSPSMLSPGKQALRMHSGPGSGDMITVGLEGVVMDDGGAPVETAPPPKAGRMTPLGKKI